jgi:uncharacterized RDD family membrane protein YckC
MAKTPRQLDSRIEIVTPENIAFQYVLAGPFRRLPAFLIDVAIRAAVLAAAFFTILFTAGGIGLGGLGLGVFLVVWFALSWFYGGFFETVWNGQTPGKWIMRLRVLTVDGQPINALQAVLRNVLREVDAMPMLGAVPLYMLGLTAMSAGDRFQRLGDLACGTIVVVERCGKLRELAPVADKDVAALAARIPPSFRSTRAMGHALTAYVARRERFLPARRHEIALILAEPLCPIFRLPPDTNPDLLLRALYYRTFITDRPTVARAPVAPLSAKEVEVALR